MIRRHECSSAVVAGCGRVLGRRRRYHEQVELAWQRNPYSVLIPSNDRSLHLQLIVIHAEPRYTELLA